MQEMQKKRGQSLGWEDPLKEESATHSSNPAWEIHEQRILESYSPWGRKELDTTKHAHTLILQHGLVKPLKTCSFKKKTHTNFVNYKLYIDSKAYDIILAHSSLS